MVKKHVPILMSGLALGLVLVVFRSLALAQEPVSQEDAYVHIRSSIVQLERQEPIELSAERVASHTVSIEPLQLQITERLTLETRMPLTEPLLPEARLAECYHAIQPVRREFKALTGQVIGEAYSITRPVSTHDSGRGNIRPAAVRVVTSTADSGSGTLRQCLENAVPGDTCTFDPGVFPPISPVTIALSSELPWIITDNLTIDASDAGVILDGSGLSSGDGFTIVGTNGVSILGLQILYFPRNGITVGLGAMNTTIGGNRFTGRGPLGQGNLISGNRLAGVWFQNSAMGSAVLGNYIGTNISGTAALGNASDGVILMDGAMDNVIGGDTSGTRNVISGNGDVGVQIQDPGTSGNRVIGNYIGVDASGTISLSNQSGVLISSATDNAIGGTNATPGSDCNGDCNLISGNRQVGIQIQLLGTPGNRVLGNYIGTDVSGSGVLGNGSSGVVLILTTDNMVGGDTPGARNLISGNEDAGVWIEGSGTSGNRVLGNHIGTDISGTVSISNHWGVVILEGPTDNTIGGTNATPGSDCTGACNLISGNGDAGVWIEGPETSGNRVLGNYIGTDVSGSGVLDNGDFGVLVGFEATNNIVGGSNPGEGNLISGHGEAGVWIQNAGTMSNTVLGNRIGTDVSGTVSIANYRGVRILEGPTYNTIGGAGSGACNLISGNTYGVVIQDSGTANNTVLGNYIGTDFSGTAALDNQLAGVVIGNKTMSNTVGGDTSEARNLISGNEMAGVAIWDAGGTAGNRVLGNYIGTDVSGTAAIPNYWGVYIASGATNNVIGISNTIAYNALDGVVVSDTNTLRNTVTRNAIHDNGGLGIENTNGGNTELPPPTITTVISTSVSGQTGPSHTVEVFSDNDGEGRWFEGSVTADGDGNFTVTQPAGFRGPNLTATATDADGNTSEFSRPPVPISPGQEIFLPIIIKSSD